MLIRVINEGWVDDFTLEVEDSVRDINNQLDDYDLVVYCDFQNKRVKLDLIDGDTGNVLSRVFILNGKLEDSLVSDSVYALILKEVDVLLKKAGRELKLK